MDFMSDQLFDGRPFRILTVIDGHTREALATVPRASFRAYQVVEVLDRLATERGRPKSLRVDTSAAELPAARVRRQGARPVGLSERRGDRLLPARETDGQRADRGVQRPPAGGVPERVLVLVDGRCAGSDRRLEVCLQRGPAAFGLGELDPEGLRQPSSSSPTSCLATGPESGAGPAGHALTSNPDHPMGAGQKSAARTGDSSPWPFAWEP
jgi:hypothetical protein